MDDQKLSKLKVFFREPRNMVALYISLFWAVVIIAISMARFYPEWFRLLESLHLQTLFSQFDAEQYATGMKNLESYTNNPNLEMVLRLWSLSISAVLGGLIGFMLFLKPNIKKLQDNLVPKFFVELIASVLLIYILIHGLSEYWVPPVYSWYKFSTYNTLTLYFVSFAFLGSALSLVILLKHIFFLFNYMFRKSEKLA